MTSEIDCEQKETLGNQIQLKSSQAGTLVALDRRGFNEF